LKMFYVCSLVDLPELLSERLFQIKSYRLTYRPVFPFNYYVFVRMLPRRSWYSELPLNRSMLRKPLFIPVLISLPPEGLPVLTFLNGLLMQACLLILWAA